MSLSRATTVCQLCLWMNWRLEWCTSWQFTWLAIFFINNYIAIPLWLGYKFFSVFTSCCLCLALCWECDALTFVLFGFSCCRFRSLFNSPNAIVWVCVYVCAWVWVCWYVELSRILSSSSGRHVFGFFSAFSSYFFFSSQSVFVLDNWRRSTKFGDIQNTTHSNSIYENV